ncbi:MAG: acyl-CoA dehydrogenase family protein [Lysobacterales bacterium]
MLSAEQQQLREAMLRQCSEFSDEYWSEHDRSGEFPEDFYRAIADAGWLGIAMPSEVGGSGLGITEAAVMMQAIAESGAGMSGASAIHINIFGLNPVVVFGTEAQKQRMLPPLLSGAEKACFAVTEANAGHNTAQISTRAERQPDGSYRISGDKIWTSTAQVADKVLILARTAPIEASKRKLDGLSLFYTELDRSRIEVRLIHKMGRHAVDSNMLFIEDLAVPAEDLIGEAGKGFEYLLHGLNPERILIAAEAVGLGRAAIERAARYARERVVFGRPIGQNQGIAHPLAQAWAELEAANLMVLEAARRYDAGESCGIQANAAKLLASEAAFRACERAVLTLGGMGYAQEYHVERLLRESLIPRLAPIGNQMILNFLAEKALDLPKSY